MLMVIAARNPDGSALDTDQVLEAIAHATSKQSLHFSIRPMVEHGLLCKTVREKRRGRVRQLIEATELGRSMAAPAGVPFREVDALDLS